MTYGELIVHHLTLIRSDLQSKGKTQQLARNHRSAIKAWMRGRFSEDTPVGQEFGGGFSITLREHLDALADEDKSPSTISTRKTILIKWRETWVEMLKGRESFELPKDFPGALTFLKERAGVSYEEIARQVGVKYSSLIREWSKGRQLPMGENLPIVARLEQYFGQPANTLLARLPRFMFGARGVIKHGLTPYRRHLQKAQKDTYKINHWPPQVEAEWNRLVRVYTDPAWARLQNEQREIYWRIRAHDGSCPTAELNRAWMSSFFGYLCLPVNDDEPVLGGRGLRREDLSLALLSDGALVYDYMEFKRERTYLKAYNAQTKSSLGFCASLVRPKTGYLWRQQHFAAKLLNPLPEGQWQDWCKRNHAIFVGFHKDFQKQKKFKKTRDPFDGVRALIVNEQHPIDVLLDLAAAVEADMPPSGYNPRERAVHYQLFFFVKFASNIPLRALNFSLLTYRADNTGHLYQRSNGSWWVRLAAEEFKNQQWTDEKDEYDIPIEESLRPVIEEYLWLHRSHLAGADRCDYVLRPSRCQLEASVAAPVCRWDMSKWIYKLSQRYIPGCPGFHLHAIRHLVATEFIKNQPDGFAVAAAVLHDHEQTVRDAYAWVMPKDKIKHWNDYFHRQQDRHRQKRAEPPAGAGR